MSHFTVLVRFNGKLEDAEETIAGMLEPYDENKVCAEEPDENYTPEKLMDDIKEVVNQLSHTNPPSYLVLYVKHLPFLRTVIEDVKKIGWEEMLKIHREQLNKAFAISYYGTQIHDDGLIYTTYNGDSKWDWYSVGGRWSGQFKLKPGAKGKEGEPGTGDNPVGIDIAYAKDIDWKRMAKEERARAEKNWENAEKEPDPGKRYWEYGIEKDETKEQFIARHSVGFSSFAVLDDDGWHERGEMGWFGTVKPGEETEATWQTEYKKRFLSDFEDDTVLAVVDCHI